MFCGDVVDSDGTGGLISMVWNLFSGTCWFYLCIQLCSCWLGISSGRLCQFSMHLELDLLDAWARIEMCINEINIWMTQNLLKLNSNKTEFILFGTRQQLSKVDDISLQISNGTVKPVNVRNLGYVMDSLLKNGPHVNKMTSSCYCKLCNITKIRPSLDTRSAQLITQALVLSCTDYCNSL